MLQRNLAMHSRKVFYIAIPIICVIFILDLPLFLTQTSIFVQQYLGIFWGVVTALVFISKPGNVKQENPQWYDFLLAACALILGFYVLFYYPQIIVTIGVVTPLRIFFSFMAVILVLESTRRMIGWSVLIIAALFIGYALFGYLLPGLLQTRYISWDRLFYQLFVGADCLFGTPLRTAVLVVFSFLLFAQLLFATGGGSFLTDLALALMGRYRGGPAKAAIVASAFFGSMSGSAVANVASTGAVTIPLMKKTGYSPIFSGAIESVASTGGALMPPVMGAAAFLMAEFLAIPYSEIVLMALFPSLLYYLGQFIQVHLRAIKTGLRGLSQKEVPPLGETIKKGWIYLLPIIVLIYALFFLYQRPEVAALYASVTIIIVALIGKETRRIFTWKGIFELLKATTLATLQLATLTAAAGFIVGIVSYTGLGLSLSQALTQLSGQNLYLLMLLTAITSTILGMSMPSVPCYILLAILAAPAMVKLGVPPVAAHFFVFYYGTLSFITPPVCLAVYAGATIADSPPMATAIQAMKLAFVGYFVPFIFILNPAILQIGSTSEIIISLLLAIMAVFIMAIALEGYLLRNLFLMEKILFFIAGIAIFLPERLSSLVGVIVAASVLLFVFKSKKLSAKNMLSKKFC